ncbi:hypothetical protein H9632_07545 [Solibacillus sp. Sa1YVA6]|uniref:Uncharacterized protein n=1 Tax=Solibacillus merdavium TaxID=2762218 RepID=A0ABR8XLW2_9BACL|nr:hypothetical protein [Solibacillus merdavium]
MIYRRDLDVRIVSTLLEFIEEKEFELVDEYYECRLQRKELEQLITDLEEDIRYAGLRNKSFDFCILDEITSRRDEDIEILVKLFDSIANDPRALGYVAHYHTPNNHILL